MEFTELTSDTINSKEELLKLIEENCIKARSIKATVEKLKINTEVNHTSKTKDITKITKEFKTQKETESENTFEQVMKSYIQEFSKLDYDVTKEDVLEMLPDKEDYNFEVINLRLQAESIREIKELNEFINLSLEELTEKELKEFQTAIKKEKKKISLLKEIHEEKEESNFQEHKKNNIVLGINQTGTVRIIDDLEHISSEYYPRFQDLVNSIINNTFKNMKSLVVPGKNQGLCEVKGFGVRIVFKRLNKDTYALITAFVKKSDSGKGYRDNLFTRINEFLQNEEEIKSNLENEEFIKENEFNVNYLLDLLSPKKEKKIIKGDQNDSGRSI